MHFVDINQEMKEKLSIKPITILGLRSVEIYIYIYENLLIYASFAMAGEDEESNQRGGGSLKSGEPMSALIKKMG